MISQSIDRLFEGLPCGKYTIKLAQSEAEKREVFKLRFEIFNEELGEGIPENVSTGLDVDGFDAVCDHLMVLADGRPVGTYRLLWGASVPPTGFYTQTEFNMNAINAPKHEMVELGRGCIARAHRKQTTLLSLFWGLYHYINARNARFLFGCGSLAVQNANDAEATYEHLKKLGVIPQPEKVFPLEENNFSAIGGAGTPQVPPLVELYLKFGASVLGRPAYDPVFRCYDLFVFFDMHQLTDWGNDLIRRFDARLGCVLNSTQEP